MKTVTLLPATKRLKQLIVEFGPEWEEIASLRLAPCFDWTPGLLLRSKDGLHERWVKPEWITRN